MSWAREGGVPGRVRSMYQNAPAMTTAGEPARSPAAPFLRDARQVKLDRPRGQNHCAGLLSQQFISLNERQVT